MSGRVGKCRNDDGKCREMSGNVGISSGGGPCQGGKWRPFCSTPLEGENDKK